MEQLQARELRLGGAVEVGLRESGVECCERVKDMYITPAQERANTKGKQQRKNRQPLTSAPSCGTIFSASAASQTGRRHLETRSRRRTLSHAMGARSSSPINGSRWMRSCLWGGGGWMTGDGKACQNFSYSHQPTPSSQPPRQIRTRRTHVEQQADAPIVDLLGLALGGQFLV